ncbi:hypothetical protein CC85DRAFT_300397 [Cutaneotrichosporon oleaginosum]|uniref:Uncharacterized protein n=1 Tax=Cutaneotrichosporon oleaginosum TaxID=879819 RepID=A0A0J0XTZ1_9TREE|nr:uncharacterized protein CC85DRAFT_300397 [Cutaneotrichosporon oleaginosum]KLT44553.1 hypothetical protein CC85DRAFT_300397 [Cutaneotrichosporon oleaginosum]TXT13933.1 hypothetical protein COLE_00126 [Cutaneotrichosporon oleaginosum]
MVAIPIDTHPHILDAILAHAPYESLLALRAACRSLRGRVDALLVQHIAFLGIDLLAVWDNRRVRIPRTEWWDVTALTEAVRAVDFFGAVAVRPNLPSRAERCWCEVQLRDSRVSLTQVKVVRQWTREHRCVDVTAPRVVTLLPPGKPQYFGRPCPELAPVAVFLCSPGALRCDVAGLGHVVIRAQPSDENEVDPTILCLDLARVLALADTGCTLVGWADLPFLRKWATKGDVRAQIARNVAAELILEHYVDEDDAPAIVDENLRIITHEEYRAEIGEELYAFESYCV